MRFITPAGRGRILRATFATICVMAALLMLAPDVGAQERSGQPGVNENDSGDFIPAATIAEIMESMVAPSAQALWDSVAFISTMEGTIDLKPETDEDWEKLRWTAVTMAEASNALLIPGRRVDQPGVVADDPDEELGPDEIQALIASKRQAWVAFAHVLHAAAMDTLRAIDARDVDGLSDVGGTIDAACESCHLQFWYPE